MKTLRNVPVLCAIPKLWDAILDLMDPEPERKPKREDYYHPNEDDELLKEFAEDHGVSAEELRKQNDAYEKSIQEFGEKLKAFKKTLEEEAETDRVVDRMLSDEEVEKTVDDMAEKLADRLIKTMEEKETASEGESKPAEEPKEVTPTDPPTEEEKPAAEPEDASEPATFGATVKSSPSNVNKLRRDKDIIAAKKKKQAKKKKAKQKYPGATAEAPYGYTKAGAIRKRRPPKHVPKTGEVTASTGKVRKTRDTTPLTTAHYDRTILQFKRRDYRFAKGIDKKRTSNIEMGRLLNIEFGMNKHHENFVRMYRGDYPRSAYPAPKPGTVFPWENQPLDKVHDFKDIDKLNIVTVKTKKKSS
jgi:hypothetical protein